MCQADTALGHAQQKLVLKQLTARLLAIQTETREWEHLLGHLASPLTQSLKNTAEQLQVVLNQLQEAEGLLPAPATAHDHHEHHHHVTFVSK